MTTLTDFLLARIAEDEARARRTLVLWHSNGGMLDLSRYVGPTQTMAECEAKRHIIELHYSWALEVARCPAPPFGPILEAKVVGAETFLRVLARVYKGHPDFDTRWLP